VCLSARNSDEKRGIGLQTSAQSGTPDSVRCARLVRGELAALGIRRRRTTIIHRTVRWCTGLSSEPTVGHAIRGRRMAAPTVSWVHRTVSGAPSGSKEQQSTLPELEGNRAPDKLQLLSGGALHCPVRH
jgi:hypothetical protein